MSYLKKGIWSLSGLFFLIAAANVIGYFTRAVLARTLTPELYGLFYSAFALVMFLSTLTVGIHVAVVKYTASLVAKNKFNQLKYAIILTSSWRIGISAVLSLILYLGADWLAEVYFKFPAAPMIKIFAVVLFFLNGSRIMASILNGLQKNIYYGLVEFSQKFLFLIILLLLFKFSLLSKSALTTSYALAIGFGLTSLIFLFPSLKHSKFFQSKSKKSKPLKKKIFRFSVFSTLTYAANSMIGHIDTLMLTSMRTLSEVGVYNVVLPTVMVLSVFGASIHKIYFPMISEMWAKKQMDSLKQGFEVLYKYTLVAIVPMALTLMVFPKEIIRILFTAEYVSGFRVMQILPLSIIFLATFQVLAAILKGMGKPEEVTKMVFIVAVLNVITNFILIKQLGILGAGIASTISFFVLMILCIRSVKKHVDIHPNYGEYLRIISASVVFVVVANLTKTLLETNQYLEAILCLGISAIVYVGVCFLLKLLTIKELKFFMKNAVK